MLIQGKEWDRQLANEIRIKIRLHYAKLWDGNSFEVKVSKKLYNQGASVLEACVAIRMGIITPDIPFQFELNDDSMLKVMFTEW